VRDELGHEDGPVDLFDETRPSIARVYDYVLGGKEHFEIDRQVSKALFAAVPESRQLAQENRMLLRRAVRWLVTEGGIRQIIDFGSGLPTVGNVHETAHAIDPTIRIAYVDIDPIVLTHARALLSDVETTAVVLGDARDPAAVFGEPAVQELIRPDEPFAMIASGILHHFDDDVAAATATAMRAQLTPGSYLFSSNFLDDDEDRAKRLEEAFIDGGLGTGRFRRWAELQAFFDGLEMVDPGLVYADDWHPDRATPKSSPVHTLYAGGLGRKPA
jgi:hypothetical protein